MGDLIPFIRPTKRLGSRPVLASPHPALARAALKAILTGKENDMLIARIKASAAITMAGQYAVRLAIASPLGRDLFAISPAQAEQLRKDLEAVLNRVRADARQASGTPLPGSGS